MRKGDGHIVEEQLPTQTPSAESPASDTRREIYEWLQCIVIALVACVLIFVFVARIIDVKGVSMMQTLQDGDKVIITRLAGDYEYGDIVVLRAEGLRSEPIIKRVIATEGQTVDIDFAAGIVYVDGVALQEDYVNELTYTREDFSEPVTVPEGCIFVMGDNRNNSTDSRSDMVGCVDKRSVLGKAVFRLLPFRSIGSLVF